MLNSADCQKKKLGMLLGCQTFLRRQCQKLLSGNVIRWYGNVLNCLFLSLIDLPKVVHCSIYCMLDYCKALNSTASRQDAAAQLITGPKNKERKGSTLSGGESIKKFYCLHFRT